MADGEGEGGAARPPRKGGKIGGVPTWAIYAGAGLAIGAVYLIWKGRKTQAAQGQTGTAQNATSGQQPGYGQPQGPDIIPIDQGLTDQQVEDIVGAITSLQGQQSTAPTSTSPDWMSEEAQALATYTGESIDQIKWELQGKDPSQGPDPQPGGRHLPNNNLYGSWVNMDGFANGAIPTTDVRGGNGQDQNGWSGGRGMHGGGQHFGGHGGGGHGGGQGGKRRGGGRRGGGQ